LYINATATYQGLFGYISAATVKNLTVEGSVTSTANYAAGIIASSAGASVIENCHNKATVSGTTYVGGLLAYSENAAIRMANCTNSGNISASVSYAGGVVGSIATGTTATLDRVSNSGDISAGTNYAGGIAGSSAAAQIGNACNTGNVNATGVNVAGISGSLTAAGSITNAYNAGVAKSNAIAGTATGSRNNVYTLDESYTDATVKTADEFASGEVSWLLGAAFGQAIGVDALPLLNGTPVYKVTYTNNLDAETDSLYTNGALPEIAKEGYTSSWKTAEDGGDITEVSADSELFLFFEQTTTDPCNYIVLDLSASLIPEESFTFPAGGGAFTNTDDPDEYFMFEVEHFSFSYFDTYEFTVSNRGDNTDYGSNNAGSASLGWLSGDNMWGTMAGGGIKTDVNGNVLKNESGKVSVENSIPFVSAYYMEYMGEMPLQVILTDAEAPYEAVGMYINNNPWPYYGNIYGDGFARALNQDGDYFQVTIHGLNGDYEDNGKSVVYKLAEYKNGTLHQNTEWEWVDLTSLGDVYGFHFTVEGSDTGDYGLNTAAYFNLDKLTVRSCNDAPTTAIPAIATGKVSIYPNPFAEYIVVNATGAGNATIYDLSGKAVLNTALKAGENIINTVSLKRGVYVLKNGANSVKIVK
jgi:hypothetical protein